MLLYHTLFSLAIMFLIKYRKNKKCAAEATHEKRIAPLLRNK